MAATIKSRVLVREEKGMGGISMKRLVFCGMGAGMTYFIINLSPLRDLSIPSLILLFCLLVFLSGSRYGLARYQWILLNTQGRLLLHLSWHPSSLFAQLFATFKIQMAGIDIYGLDLFKATDHSGLESELMGIEILDTDALTAGGFQLLSQDGIWQEAG